MATIDINNTSDKNIFTEPQSGNIQIIGDMKSIPLDVSKELDIYSKVFITRETDLFRNYHFLEARLSDYRIFGELPDGDKKLLFTVKTHFKCCECCSQCGVLCCCCFAYFFCDTILIQLDYKRNGNNFYTQGFNAHKGCHCCFLKCMVCPCCCNCYDVLYLRENTDPDNPDYRNVGTHTGQTLDKINCCFCCCCEDKVVKYVSQNGMEGHTLRAKCCDICKTNFYMCCCLCCCCCCGGKDLEISIENPNGQKVGNIFVPNGCCSSLVESCCYCPGRRFEVNFPKNITSSEKFQIIAEAVHFDFDNHIL